MRTNGVWFSRKEDSLIFHGQKKKSLHTNQKIKLQHILEKLFHMTKNIYWINWTTSDKKRLGTGPISNKERSHIVSSYITKSTGNPQRFLTMKKATIKESSKNL